LKTSNIVPQLTRLLKLITTTDFSKYENKKIGSTKEVQTIASIRLNITDKDPKVDLIICDYEIPNVIFDLGS